MTIKEIDIEIGQAKKSLELNRVMDCFDSLDLLLKELKEWWANSRFDELQGLYKQMLRYLLKGIDDPLQQAIYKRFINDIYVLIDDVEQVLKTRNASEYQYQKKRYSTIYPVFQLDVVADEIASYENRELVRREMKELVDEQKSSTIILSDRLLYEAKLRELFEYYWLLSRFDTDQSFALNAFIEKDNISRIPKLLIVSAVTLSLLRIFDEKKMEWLMQMAVYDDEELRQRAIVGLVLILSRHGQRLQFLIPTMDKLNKLCSQERFKEEFENCFLQLVRTSETESISKRVQEELLPEMMKLGPQLKDKIQSDYSHYNDEMEKKNPEWETFLEDSGISEKIKEFGDLQMQGADVYVTTFAALKSFPFFMPLSSWFLPFDSNNSQISSLFQENSKLLKAFMKSPFLCNSDKYSFCLSLIQMPETQQEIMGDAFKEESEQLDEIMTDQQILDQNQNTKSLSNQYVQDLYRFYTLYPQHLDFKNPLPEVLQFYHSPLFNSFFPSISSKLRIAEFFFSKNLFVESLEQFIIIVKLGESSASLYQKIGYCYQQLHQFEEAVEFYQKADLLQNADRWTMSRISFCYRSLGKYEEALVVYNQMSNLFPDDSSFLSGAAACLYELGRYDEALSLYFKLDYYRPDTLSVWRLIAWCSFLAGKNEQAKKYFNKILVKGAEAVDYLNMGHLAWVEHDLTQAHHDYLNSLLLSDTKEVFIDMFMKDAQCLQDKGIDRWSIDLMLDALRLYGENDTI